MTAAVPIIGPGALAVLLTMSEVSELTRIPIATLRDYRFKGTGPKSGKVGGRVMYRESDVLAWIDAQFEEQAG